MGAAAAARLLPFDTLAPEGLPVMSGDDSTPLPDGSGDDSGDFAPEQFTPPREYTGPSFADELQARPECELIGGPLDGFIFRWPRDKGRAAFVDPDKPGHTMLYVRDDGPTADGETGEPIGGADYDRSRFCFRGWEPVAPQSR